MDESYYNLEEKLQTVWSTKQEWIPTILSFWTILWKTTNYDFFNILRNAMNYLNIIDEVKMERKGKKHMKTHIRMEKHINTDIWIFETIAYPSANLKLFIDKVNKYKVVLLSFKIVYNSKSLSSQQRGYLYKT